VWTFIRKEGCCSACCSGLTDPVVAHGPYVIVRTLGALMSLCVAASPHPLILYAFDDPDGPRTHLLTSTVLRAGSCNQARLSESGVRIITDEPLQGDLAPGVRDGTVQDQQEDRRGHRGYRLSRCHRRAVASS